jgi:hypothetical protein
MKMVNRKIVASLAVTALVVAGNLVAACVPNASSDAFNTPTPPPIPTPAPVVHCQIVWTTPNGAGFDAYVVDGEQSLWVSGAATTATSAAAGFTTYYVEGVSFAGTHTADISAPTATITSTSGDFTLTMSVNGTHVGASVAYDDVTNDPILGYDTAGNIDFNTGSIGSAGKGTFAGVFSDSDPTTNLDFGAGTMNVTIGSPTSLGGGMTGSFATCYNLP